MSELWDDPDLEGENDWDEGEESIESDLEDAFLDPEELEGEFQEDEPDDDEQ